MNNYLTAEFLINNYTNNNESKTYIIEGEGAEKLKLEGTYNIIVSKVGLNKFQRISRRLVAISGHLEMGGLLIGHVRTHDQMRAHKWYRKIPVIRSVFKLIDFIFHRVFPKVWGLKKIYFLLTGGKNRRLTKAEVLGRLVCHGFEIIEVQSNLDGKLHFVVKKVKKVDKPQKSSYGPLYKMPRIGKNGETIYVYKFRTMHPYSEHLQDYVLKENGYSETGKPANDFRVTSWGKILRKYWIDEVPQLINVFKGDMKLMGVRPVSNRYFQDIPFHIQQLRLGQKPGCIPPYVALNKKGAKEDVLFAEEIYLRLSKKRKHGVDFSLIFLAIRNIFFKGMRSA
jgi:lipopolysaccharide/colanic/teichoic acid biosynthesis glycosyltransferase